MSSAIWRRLLLAAVALGSGASGLRAQNPGAAAEEPTGPRFGVDARLAFLITDAGGHPDRPLLEANGRVRILRARAGGAPGFVLTGGVAIGFSEFFAEVQSESFRVAGGVEVPWAIGSRRPSGRAIELVPLVEVGHLDSNGGDERSGLFTRFAVGVRIPVGGGPLYLGFEPIGLTVLPEALKSREGDSRLAFEMGLIRFGWDF
ncbi:MAG: hypothetical protein OEU54_07075 [Gemmatimonadota bacterium]|nr:hypothetical protein [Gemmatimonadota bacterium]